MYSHHLNIQYSVLHHKNTSCQFCHHFCSVDSELRKLEDCIVADVRCLVGDESVIVKWIFTFRLLFYRIRVTVNGEFLHYIYPFQFLDSPEWDSLRPSEEGVFQVNFTSCACSRNISDMKNIGFVFN